MSDAVAKLTRVGNKVVWLISDFSTSMYSPGHSNFGIFDVISPICGNSFYS